MNSGVGTISYLILFLRAIGFSKMTKSYHVNKILEPSYIGIADVQTMEEYHKGAIRLGLNCLYMTDLSLKQSLYKQELYLNFFYCLQRR